MTTLADRVLGTDPKQRLRLVQCGTALLLALGGSAYMAYLVRMGLAPSQGAAVWAALMLTGFAAFFLVIRSGLNLHFEEPSLTLAQMVFAILCSAAGYALAGPGRGGAFPSLMVIFMFSMYALPPAHVLRVAWFAVLVFGLTMGAMAWWAPQVYTPAVEGGHFIMIAVMVPTIAVFAGQLSQLRDQLRTQKKDFAVALARIQELATRDELTGLINHRHMLELMEQERQRGVRSGQTFSLAMIDIDDFEQALDVHGPAFAEQLLQRFSRETLSVIRISDLLCRWSDHQFLLMLSDTRASMGRLSLERLRERVQGIVLSTTSVPVQLSFSAGVTEHRAGESVAQTVERAEQSLAVARSASQHRVTLA